MGRPPGSPREGEAEHLLDQTERELRRLIASPQSADIRVSLLNRANTLLRFLIRAGLRDLADPGRTLKPPDRTLKPWRKRAEAPFQVTGGGATDRNYPLHVICPHCGSGAAELLPRIGDRSDYRCSKCGTFSISGIQEARFEAGAADPTRARFVQGREGRRFLIG
jgi:hypothetical protein